VAYAGRIYQVHALPIYDDEGEVSSGMVMTQDITDQKRAEETLYKSQQRYEQLVNSIDGIVWEGDAYTFHYSFVSQQAERLLGYPVERWINEPTFWSDHIHPEDREWAINFCVLSTAQKKDHVFEYRMIAADGRIVWLRDIVTVILENDRPVMLRGVMVDITESKRAEVEIQERERQYRSIFESVSDGLFINRLEDGSLVDFNPAAARMHGYSEEEFRRLHPIDFIDPSSLHLFREYIETIRAGGIFRGFAVDVRKDGSSFPTEVLGTSFIYKGEPHALGVVRDTTEVTKAYQLLEERVDQRTHELQTLLEISRNVASNLDLKALLHTVFEQLKKVVDFTALTVWMVEKGDQMVIAEYQGPDSREKVLEQWNERFRLSDAADRAAGPMIIPDVRADTPEANRWREGILKHSGEIPAHISTWMSIPLTVKDRTIGLISLHHEEANAYTPRHAELALALANHAAVAIENARLFEAIRRGGEQFRAISEVGQRITSILDVEALLAQTVRLIQDAFGYYHVHIGLIEGEIVVFPAEAGVWESEPNCSHCSAHRLHIGPGTICGWVADNGKALVVPNISEEPRYLHPTGATGSGVVVPLKVKGQVIGILDVENRQIDAFEEREVAVLQSLANQVAVAIENARLYEKAQRLAALQERQKLARELHDSVSQALYGIALGSRTARIALDKPEIEKEALIEPLDYVLSLAEAGLAEMRALIFELRPESLENEGVVAALTKQSDALRARHGLQIETSFCPEPQIPLEAKETLYRIAQEALHNVVKHARASRVSLFLDANERQVTLEIQDDGVGFDAQGSFPGHLGLRSMRERAERLGGEFELESAPGEGTRIGVFIPIDPEKP
jgi:PAS domain S-box-containing protein